MSFLTPTSFSKEPYIIPNQTKNNSVLTNFIADMEKKFLTELLGLTFYEALIGGNPADTRWANIIVGASYMYSGKRFKWDGLPAYLVPQLFAEWLTKTADQWTETGNAVANTENANVASPLLKITQALQDGNKKTGAGVYCLNPYNTLYGFLLSSGTTYDDVVTPDGYQDFMHYLGTSYRNLGFVNTFGF